MHCSYSAANTSLVPTHSLPWPSADRRRQSVCVLLPPQRICTEDCKGGVAVKAVPVDRRQALSTMAWCWHKHCHSFACCCSHSSQPEGTGLQQCTSFLCYSAHAEPKRLLLQERGSRPAAGAPFLLQGCITFLYSTPLLPSAIALHCKCP